MSKERNTKKEGKKQPTMTPKERKAAKKAKKEAMKSRRGWWLTALPPIAADRLVAYSTAG